MYVADRHDNMQLNPITQVYIYGILCKNRIVIYSVPKAVVCVTGSRILASLQQDLLLTEVYLRL